MDVIKKAFFYSVLLLPTFFIVSMQRTIIDARQYLRSSQFALLDPNYDRKKIVVDTVIDSKPTRYISFITDGENNHYVIKQKRKGTVKEQFLVVSEKLSAYIAEIAEIPAHRVQILPAGMAFTGKMITEDAASILTLVPGIPIKLVKTGIYSGLYLRQTNKPTWPQEELGLNERVIASMALHPDLALIAALHTFIGNEDCHGDNLFYDEQTNRFYAIDMDKIYRMEEQRELISKLACDQIRRMLHSKEKFSQAEFDGLKLYQNTLQRLAVIFPPARIHELLDEFATLGGFDKKLYLPDLVDRVECIKDKAKRSHNHILELIDLLSRINK